MKFWELIKWRTDHGYTQKELADKLGVSIQTVWRWENGERLMPSFLGYTLKGIEGENHPPFIQVRDERCPFYLSGAS